MVHVSFFGNANTQEEYLRTAARRNPRKCYCSAVGQSALTFGRSRPCPAELDEKRASLTRAHDAWALSRDLSSLNQISKGAGVHRRICSTLQAACRRALDSSAKRTTIASVRDKPCVLDHALMSPVLPTSGTGGHLFRCSSLPPLHSLNRRSSSVART